MPDLSANEGAHPSPFLDPGSQDAARPGEPQHPTGGPQHPTLPPDLKLAAAQVYESLTVFPVIDTVPRHLPYDVLADALETGAVRVSEFGSGTVPEILVDNRGDADVLILDGEQLVGARQNRIVGRTIIVPAHAKTTIPVSCMEQGRWHLTTRRFQHGGHHSPAGLRRHARTVESACAAEMMAAAPGVLAQAQGSVWTDIAGYSAKLGGRSPTGDLGDLYERRSSDLDTWAKRFPWVDDQVGLLAFLDGEPLGLDVIGGHRLYARLHKRLVTGHVLDAIAAGPRRKRKEVGEETAAAFLRQARGANRTEAPTVGRGIYRVLSGAVVGGELVDARGLVHLSAFPAQTVMVG